MNLDCTGFVTSTRQLQGLTARAGLGGALLLLLLVVVVVAVAAAAGFAAHVWS
jgi:hypothetical protein